MEVGCDRIYHFRRASARRGLHVSAVASRLIESRVILSRIDNIIRICIVMCDARSMVQVTFALNLVSETRKKDVGFLPRRGIFAKARLRC